MVYIETESRDAAFHFSLEEALVRDYPYGEPIFMIWQTDKCAMLGRNQIAQAEIDFGYAAGEGVQIVRRSSGGGTIFTDSGTLLFTLILPDGGTAFPMDAAKAKAARPVTEALNRMGIPAGIEGRNDILVEGKKISGLAQYIRHGRICTHGSLLYDTDLDRLVRVLRPDEEKIRSKALRSARSRVTNLKAYLEPPRTVQEFRSLLKQMLFEGQDIRVVSLSEALLIQTGELYRAKYGHPSWTFGQSPPFTFRNGRRFPGGRLEVFLQIEKGQIAGCAIRGDFLSAAPVRDLESLLENQPYRAAALDDVLGSLSLNPYLGQISKDELLSVLFESR